MASVFKLPLISYASHLDHIIQDETLKFISTLSLLAGPHSLSLLQLWCWPVISREQEGAAASYCLYCRRVKAMLCRVQALKMALKQNSSRTWLTFSVVGQLALYSHKGVKKLVPCACRLLH